MKDLTGKDPNNEEFLGGASFVPENLGSTSIDPLPAVVDTVPANSNDTAIARSSGPSSARQTVALVDAAKGPDGKMDQVALKRLLEHDVKLVELEQAGAGDMAKIPRDGRLAIAAVVRDGIIAAAAMGVGAFLMSMDLQMGGVMLGASVYGITKGMVGGRS